MDPEDLLKPGVLVPIAIVVVVLAGIAIAVVRTILARRTGANLQKWTRGAYAIWTGGEDSGTWTSKRAQTSLENWYGATGAPRFWEVIRDLRDGTTSNPAWDRVRALDLLRIGRAAMFIDDEQCWEEAAKIGAELQRLYPSWENLAQSFEAGMHAWQHRQKVTSPQELGRVQKNLAALRGQIWPVVAYQTKLGGDD